MCDDDLVERVARAIFEAHNSERPGVSWDDDTRDWERDEYQAQARAAIASIEAAGYVVVPREPTEKMLDAVVSDGSWVWAELVWQAMIDAALEKDKANVG